MSGTVKTVEVWRGDFLESVHDVHVVVSDTQGIVEAWGDAERMILPRSSCKMVQALPLAESGLSLSAAQLALACASHQGAAIHTDRVDAWLGDLGLSDDDLRCGPQSPGDTNTHRGLIRANKAPRQCHNTCSGKHAGFLALSQHLGGGPEYLERDHPVQIGVKDAFEDMTGEDSPGFVIDGCSAPNHACTLSGLAHAMARMASPGGGARGKASARLVSAMMEHPDLVAGETRACTELMRATKGEAAIKTGAEGVFVGILPDKGLGIALKAVDGATRASEAMMAALLVRYGLLDVLHPLARKRMEGPITNWRGIETGRIRVRL